MKHRTARLILDFVLVATLVFEMLYMLTGDVLHEIVGALFFVTLIVHMIFGRRFINGLRSKSASERGLTGKQRAMSCVMVALLAVAGLLLVSSILISNILCTATGWMLPPAAYSVVAFLHMVCAYVVCVATVMHVGLHWISLFKVFQVPYNPARRSAISTGVTAAAALGVIAIGAVASKEVAGWGIADQLLGGTAEAEEMGNASSENANSGSNSDGTNQSTPSANGASDTGSKLDKRGAVPGTSSSSSDSVPSSPNSSQDSSDGTLSGGSSSGSSSSGTTSGYCTLCHKRCPLSAPQCNKPYQAGLL